jgi:hypothetical protein
MARNVGKGVLFIAGAGALVALLANLDDIKGSKESKDHWYLVPLGVVAIGYMLRRRGNPYASAVMAVGGALFALAYAAQRAADKAQAQPPQQPPPPQPQKPVQSFAPRGETGAPFGLLPGQEGFWVQLPDGRMLRLPSPPGRNPFPTFVG